MLNLLHRVLLFSLLLIGSATMDLRAQTLQIDSLKASYLNGFIDFLRWDGELNSNSATIGIIGSKELVNHLNKIASKKTRGRNLKIISLDVDSDFSGVDVLYVSRGHRKHWSSIQTKGREESALLVGEEEGFLEQGGCIEFTLRRNRLRFIISPQNAKNCGIEVSSKLVELALERK